MPRLIVVAWTALVGCSGGGETQPDSEVSDVSSPRCDVTKPFGAPSLVDGINSEHDDRWGWQTADGLTVYFSRNPTGGSAFDLYVATRASLDAPFAGARLLEPSRVNTENRPIVTDDGLSLFLECVNDASKARIHVSTRSAPSDVFPMHEPVPFETEPAANDFNPWISGDGLHMYFTSDRLGFNDVFTSTRATTASPFGTPMPVTELNSMWGDYMGALSIDGLEILFESTRDTNFANGDIFHALRATPTEPFGAPTKLTELSDAVTNEYPSWVSPDRCQLMFTSNRGGGPGRDDVWIASRPL